ncbi:hypothetical protein DQ384_22860 [Sphaerisporangium album]|uniref:Uncharacterized protein n=1 Tax=Sphaerisporangium album TaxID=509200 RepID=A0A367FE41_9ACTN|nr:hypothetical protein [Sphaerisporangium album]RCG28594.1 hypothetical protein DQ384_22860 [Sphaerisporangium album]
MMIDVVLPCLDDEEAALPWVLGRMPDGYRPIDRRFGHPLEMVLRAAAYGRRITGTAVAYRPRVGRSKVTGTVRGTFRAIRDMRRVMGEVGGGVVRTGGAA